MTDDNYRAAPFANAFANSSRIKAKRVEGEGIVGADERLLPGNKRGETISSPRSSSPLLRLRIHRGRKGGGGGGGKEGAYNRVNLGRVGVKITDGTAAVDDLGL